MASEGRLPQQADMRLSPKKEAQSLLGNPLAIGWRNLKQHLKMSATQRHTERGREPDEHGNTSQP